MHRKKGTPLPQFNLPENFKFTTYQSGDEKAWAKIETSVLEFADELEALIYFQKEYMPLAAELKRRCVFIEKNDGEKIATGTAWWCYSGVRRDPWLQWIAVKPQYQNQGLGKAIVSKVTQLMIEIEGDRDFYLHTQTWSHRAMRIYEKAGYTITNEKNLSHYSNDNYEQALAVLNRINSQA